MGARGVTGATEAREEREREARGDSGDRKSSPPLGPSLSPAVWLPLGSTLDQGEKEIIRATLSHQHGNKSRAAEVLGISRKTLHRKMREYQLDG